MFRKTLVRNHASIWLCFSVLIVSAVMMHPTGASLIALGAEALLLAALRSVAHVEGGSARGAAGSLRGPDR